MTETPHSDTRPGQAATPPGSTDPQGPGASPGGIVPPVELSPPPCWLESELGGTREQGFTGKLCILYGDLKAHTRWHELSDDCEDARPCPACRVVALEEAVRVMAGTLRSIRDSDVMRPKVVPSYESSLAATVLSSPVVKAVLDAEKPGGERE